MKKDSRGFTLIEILVVIGIITILASVVLVAINPSRQFKLARDSQRIANVQAIVNAIHQNMSEHQGNLVCEGAQRELPQVMTKMEADPAIRESYGEGGYLGDIAACIVPDYIASMPFDPSAPGAHYHDKNEYKTGYEIMEDAGGRVTASSTGELTATISATQ